MPGGDLVPDRQARSSTGRPSRTAVPAWPGENGRNDLMVDATDPMAWPTEPIMDVIPPISPLMMETPAFHSRWPTSPSAERIMPGIRLT